MLVWIIFIISVVTFLAVDLGIFNRNPHVINNKEAALWTSIWVFTALLFTLAIYWIYKSGYINNTDQLTPTEASLKYLTGYLIELSLSIDNIFVIAVIFTSFNIPQKYQHRVLFWGILGAIVFRAFMIFFGIILIRKFDWMIYVFGGFLIYTAIKMASKKEDGFNPRSSFVYKNIRKYVPITTHIEGQKFFVKRKHIKAITPLFMALVIIEFTDILFAMDSIPAILAITSDSFLVFTSNIMAILGLRSMYFFLSNLLKKFVYLKYSLIVILTFVGIKLILSHYVQFKEWMSLSVIGISLTGGILASMFFKEKSNPAL
ncbi:TerC family protein [Abyssalbus ytuae]|uniref:TerC family protein n=1 Tax=Abyssalbus ytuae TaxID=2926907 RepID=A0A9E7D328_9FLAO|nr:TerC family protein [Abyssalbus ytuae]UOB17364.1 TerC family protein [Abyssalbus ytuae]